MTATLKELLEIAQCPNCDGSGGKQISETECEQCQWCDEKNKLIAETVTVQPNDTLCREAGQKDAR